VLVTTAFGVLGFMNTFTVEASASSYGTLMLSVLLFVIADPILFMCDKDTKKIISIIRRALNKPNNQRCNIQGVVSPDKIKTTKL
jgi:hypothetical protein